MNIPILLVTLRTTSADADAAAAAADDDDDDDCGASKVLVYCSAPCSSVLNSLDATRVRRCEGRSCQA